VRVRALTAHTNRGGTKSLRRLEMSLLEAGVTVSAHRRRSRALSRQMMIVDKQILHVYGFNFTGPRHSQEPQLRRHQQEQEMINEANKLFTATSIACRTPPIRALRRQSRQRARPARPLHRRRAQASPNLTTRRRRRRMLRLLTERVKPASTCASSPSRSQVDREHQERALPGRRCTSAPSCATASAPSSAAKSPPPRAREAARGRRLITDEVVVRQMLDVFEKDWLQTPSGGRNGGRRRKPSGKRRSATMCSSRCLRWNPGGRLACHMRRVRTSQATVVSSRRRAPFGRLTQLFL